MKVDKATLTTYIDELGLSDEVRTSVLTELEKNDKAAEQFVGQRLRQSDYTKKTQELSDARKALDGTVSQQVQDYAAKLQQAETRMGTILKDLETEKISRTTAEARLQRVKEQYELSDDDIPSVTPPSRTGGAGGAGDQGGQGGLDIDGKLAAFKKDLIKELMPELMTFPGISSTIDEIRDQHKELTGKRLTHTEVQELLKTAPNEGGLMASWEKKYDIPKIRTEQYETALEKKHREKWDAEEKAKASERALAGVRQNSEDNSVRLSPVLNREFDKNDDSRSGGDEGKGNGTGSRGRGAADKQSNQPKLSGSERAATKWMERRNQGIPLGQAAPAK